MDSTSLSILLCLTISIWFVFTRHRRAAKKLPPGPYPLPIIGNIFQLGKKTHQTLAKFSKIHGPLMSLHLGNLYTVVVSSPEMAKEMLQKHDQVTSSRIIPESASAHNHHKISIGYLPAGDQWRKLHKLSREQMFTSQRLKASQQLRQDKLQKLCDYLKECCDSGRAVNIGEAAFTTTVNLMSAMLFSAEVASFDSNAATEFMGIMDGMVNVLGAPNLADFFPILKPFDPQGIKRMSEFYWGKGLDFIEAVINDRMQSRSLDDSPKKNNDFLETLLEQLGEGTEYKLSIDDIKHLLVDIFVGGSHSCASTIEWIMTELLLNPDKLLKVKQELRNMIGENKLVEESDIERLPYLQAAIKEIFRCHPIAPLLFPHKSECDIQVRDYLIPKGTQIIFNVWAIGRDPNIWPNPDCFEPERFLDRKIDFKGQHFELIPFGSGRRKCPGLPLADRMIHVMLATLINNFDWKLVPDGKVSDLVEEEFGVTLHLAVPIKAIPIKLQ